jgi:hypothetical protein
MAGITDLINEITGSRRPRQNQVRILNSEFEPILQTVGILEFSDNLHDRVMYHPIEDGSLIADHRVIEPLEIKLTCKLTNLDFQSVYFKISDLFYNKTKLIVQSKVNSYLDMYVNGLPTRQNADNYSGIDIEISFQQALFTKPQYGINPKDKSNANTVQAGTKQSTDATTDQTSQATEAANSISGKAA